MYHTIRPSIEILEKIFLSYQKSTHNNCEALRNTEKHKGKKSYIFLSLDNLHKHLGVFSFRSLSTSFTCLQNHILYLHSTLHYELLCTLLQNHASIWLYSIHSILKNGNHLINHLLSLDSFADWIP